MPSSQRSAKIHTGLLLAMILSPWICIVVLLAYNSSEPDEQRTASESLGPRRTSPARLPGASSSTDRLATVDQTGWLPDLHADHGFVGSDACRDCHAANHSSWKASYHSSMTQVATDEAVVPSFDDVALTSRGRTWELSRRDDEFWVRMPDPDWEMEQQRRGVNLLEITDPPIVDRQIVMTTGSHNFQTYWVAGMPQRLLVQLPWFYSIVDGQWIPSEDSFLQPDPGRQFTHWNGFCIKCHSLGGIPGITPESPIVQTRVSDFGISCEACHGPAEQHVALRQAAKNSGQPLSRDEDPIVNPIRLSAERASHVCGQCHSKEIPSGDMTSFHRNGISFRAGDDLEAVRDILRSTDPVSGSLKDQYWNDGACRVGGDEFNGLIESACFLEGSGDSQLSCLSCHSMHQSDPTYQLADRMDGNHACTQCHGESQYIDQIESHTHHLPNSSGSLCYNCHMPHSSFALLKGIRSHRIDSPVVFSTSERGTRPNACNLCHLDETLEWTTQHLAEWYDTPAVELTADDRSIAASIIWVLKGDAVQRVIAAWHMGWESAHQASGDTWQAPFVGQLLRDPYGAVRLVADTALHNLPGFSDFRFSAVDETLDRSQAVSDVVSQWESTSQHGSAAEKLIDQESQLNRDAVERLLGERDDTPISIDE